MSRIDLAAIQAKDLPVVTGRAVIENYDKLTEEQRAKVDHYLTAFTPGACPSCGSRHFRWGIAHGEGMCGDCGYPARAYHRDLADGAVDRLMLALWYHPSVLEQKEEEEA